MNINIQTNNKLQYQTCIRLIINTQTNNKLQYRLYIYTTSLNDDLQEENEPFYVYNILLAKSSRK